MKMRSDSGAFFYVFTPYLRISDLTLSQTDNFSELQC